MQINARAYVAVYPRVFEAGKEQTITIAPKYDFISFEGSYTVTVLPRFYFTSHDRLAHFEGFPVEAQNNRLCFTYRFEQEQEYLIQAVPTDPEAANPRTVLTSVYALEADLLKRKVAKGELHMHTTYSDGLESPEHRIVTARKMGHDFVGITDHNSAGGSARAIAILNKIPNSMVALRGEEVHADFCPIHILALGANRPIAPEVTRRSQALLAQLAEIEAAYRPELPDHVDARSFAAAIDVFRRIRQAGGISVLCHIYWDSIHPENGTRMGTPEQLIDAVVAHGEFDAFEITSGAPGNDTKANYLQEAYYREKLPARFPIIGVTDTHTTDTALGSIFGKNYTIAFLEDFSEAGIVQAILQYHTVSVDAVVGNPICHGDLRLCKYATFLLQEYFPAHDEAVAIEGMCMAKILNGDLQYIPILEKVCADNIRELTLEWGAILPKQA